MDRETRNLLIGSAFVIGASIYGHYQLRKVERTIAEGEKKMRDTKFTLYIPVPPEMPEF